MEHKQETQAANDAGPTLRLIRPHMPLVYATIILLLTTPVACAYELSPTLVKPAAIVSSSGYSTGSPPENAIDGNLSKGWRSPLSSTQTTWNIKADLGGTYKIHGVRIFSSNDGRLYPCRFNLQTCNSTSCYGQEWMDLNPPQNSWVYSKYTTSKNGSRVFLTGGNVYGANNNGVNPCCGEYTVYRYALEKFYELQVNASAYTPEMASFTAAQSVVGMGVPLEVTVNVSKTVHTYPMNKAWFTVDGVANNATAASEGPNRILWTDTLRPRSSYTLVGYANDSRGNVVSSAPISVFVDSTTTTVTTSSTTTTIHSANPPAGVENFTYDADGNMVQDGRFAFEYNGMNMLSRVKATGTGRLVEEYSYDSAGQRNRKVSYLQDGRNRTTYYVGSHYETVIDENGVRQDTKYLFANGERVAEVHENGSKLFYLNDHLGSSSVMVDASGALVDRMLYYPFGAIKSGGATSKYGYNNKELDGTGLNYYGARYYNSQLKRWTQPDIIIQNPYDPQSLNRFSYVRNNPLKYTDPTGNVFVVDDLILLAVAGGLLAGGFYMAENWNDIKNLPPSEFRQKHSWSAFANTFVGSATSAFGGVLGKVTAGKPVAQALLANGLALAQTAITDLATGKKETPTSISFNILGANVGYTIGNMAEGRTGSTYFGMFVSTVASKFVDSFSASDNRVSSPSCMGITMTSPQFDSDYPSSSSGSRTGYYQSSRSSYVPSGTSSSSGSSQANNGKIHYSNGYTDYKNHQSVYVPGGNDDVWRP